jgi:DNA mismatch repair protein MutS2
MELAANTQREAEAARKAAEATKTDALAQYEKKMAQARENAERIATQAKREAYALLGELEQLRRDKDRTNNVDELARRARAAMKRGLDALGDVTRDSLADKTSDSDEPYALPRALQPGDRVRLADLGLEADVIKAMENGTVEVQAGIMHTFTPLENIRLLGKAEPDKNQAQPATRKHTESKLDSASSPAGTNRLDVRGQTADDCLLELDRFIDNALRIGLHEFTIVHGKGTGVLRAAVRQYLKKSPYVKTHRLGLYGEGETGVTIVELE